MIREYIIKHQDMKDPLQQTILSQYRYKGGGLQY